MEEAKRKRTASCAQVEEEEAPLMNPLKRLPDNVLAEVYDFAGRRIVRDTREGAEIVKVLPKCTLTIKDEAKAEEIRCIVGGEHGATNVVLGLKAAKQLTAEAGDALFSGGLEKLEVRSAAPGQAFRGLVGNRNLTHLALRKAPVPDQRVLFAAFRDPHCALRSIDLEYIDTEDLGVELIEALGHCKHLRELKLSQGSGTRSCTHPRELGAAFERLPNLAKVSGVQLCDEALVALQRHGSLEELVLYEGQMVRHPKALLKFLRHGTQRLRRFHLRYLNLSGDFAAVPKILEALAEKEGASQLKEVQIFDLCDRKQDLEAFSDALAKFFAGIPLRKVDFGSRPGGSPFSKEVSTSILRGIATCPTLVWLTAGRLWMTMEGAQGLADAIQADNCALRHLKIDEADDYSTDEGPRAEWGVPICEAIAQNTTLTHLDLTVCFLGPNSGRALAKALAQPTNRLRFVGLSLTAIGPDGLEAIARALCTNCELRSLELVEVTTSSTEDAGFEAIAATALVDAGRVFENCSSSSSHFATALRSPTCRLRELKLGGNAFLFTRDLLEAALDNKHLKKFEIEVISEDKEQLLDQDARAEGRDFRLTYDIHRISERRDSDLGSDASYY